MCVQDGAFVVRAAGEGRIDRVANRWPMPRIRLRACLTAL
jgi:hypothetical protein